MKFETVEYYGLTMQRPIPLGWRVRIWLANKLAPMYGYSLQSLKRRLDMAEVVRDNFANAVEHSNAQFERLYTLCWTRLTVEEQKLWMAGVGLPETQSQRLDKLKGEWE